jgi:hypothetical protein
MKSEKQKLVEAFLAGTQLQYMGNCGWVDSINGFDTLIMELSQDKLHYRIKPKTKIIHHRKYLCKDFGVYATYSLNYMHSCETDEEYEGVIETSNYFIKWLEPKQTTEIEIND